MWQQELMLWMKDDYITNLILLIQLFEVEQTIFSSRVIARNVEVWRPSDICIWGHDLSLFDYLISN